MAGKFITLAKYILYDRARATCVGCGDILSGHDADIVYVKVYGRKGAMSWMKEYCGPCLLLPKNLAETEDLKWNKLRESSKRKRKDKHDRVA